MLRASQVTADLRLSSVVRGRIEIARLDLTEPSLNLVHIEGGRWNLEALLERAARIPLAPTGTTKSEPRPQFPYIEGSSGRINVKNGPEKRPYALINADFSLWQDSDNTWGVRLKAQPLRTDLNLNDVGQLRLDGTWQRAQTLRETPVQFSIEWSRAQLGQVTKFFSGTDKGWRGEIQFDAALSGTPAKLKITSTASLDDFRRYDITSGEALHLAGRCDGEYSSETHEFHEVLCSAPVGNGLLTLTGDMGLPGNHHYAISLKAENVPVSGALMLAERAKKNMPEDLVAEGTVRGVASFQEDAAARAQPGFQGVGEITDFRLSSEATKAELGPTTVPFVVVGDALKSRGQRLPANRAGIAFPKGPHIEVGPFALNAARNGPATARGWLNRTGYSLTLAGETEITRTLRLARMAGISVPPANAEGAAQVNLQIAGSWVGATDHRGVEFSAPQVTGTAKLRNVRVTIPTASDPVEISSAEMQLAPDGVRVKKLTARAAGTVWTGTLEMPRGCGIPDACPVHFALNADEIALGQINEWVNGRPKSRPWYRVLQSASKPGQSLFARLHASGQVTASRFTVHGVTATNVSAKVNFDAGKLQASGLTADLFGGKHRGKWRVDFSVAPSVCDGSGTLTGISLAHIADEMGDAWVTGAANGGYEVKGPCTPEFWQSAEGTLQVDMRNGTLPHVLIGEDTEPLRIARLNGQAQLRSGTIEVNAAKLDSQNATYQIGGTVSLKREVDLKMTSIPADAAHGGYEITGTLAAPQVIPLSNTEQARLKTLPPK